MPISHRFCVAKFHACVLLGRDHGGLGLGSMKGYRRPEVCLTTSLFPKQGLVAPFCGANVLVDRDSSSFQDHRTSRVNQRVQAKMSMKDQRTREGITHSRMLVRLYEEERCMGTLERSLVTSRRTHKGARTQTQMPVRLYDEERCMGKPETLPRHKTTKCTRKGTRTQPQMLVRL